MFNRRCHAKSSIVLIEKRYSIHRTLGKQARDRLHIMPLYWTASIGFFLGFAFGVGCALAVMYSIYMGGYRAAIRDSRLTTPPERYNKAMKKLSALDNKRD
jgi:hypothetical protein